MEKLFSGYPVAYDIFFFNKNGLKDLYFMLNLFFSAVVLDVHNFELNYLQSINLKTGLAHELLH